MLRPPQSFENISEFLSERFSQWWIPKPQSWYPLLRLGSQHWIPKPLFWLGFLGVHCCFSFFFCSGTFPTAPIAKIGVTLPSLKRDNRGRKRNPSPNFWVRISPGGVGVFHVKGGGPKSSVCPSKPGKSNFFGGISRDCAWISRRRPENLEKKVCIQFSFPRKSQVIPRTRKRRSGCSAIPCRPCRIELRYPACAPLYVAIMIVAGKIHHPAPVRGPQSRDFGGRYCFPRFLLGFFVSTTGVDSVS